jgi:hemerythrin-like metal-binding protein
MISKRLPNTSRSRPDIFVWSGKYRVGIAKVDQQHKKLVTLINALARQYTEADNPSVLVKVLDELVSYTNYHFKAEENLMRQCGVDPEFQVGHQRAHAAFIQEVTRANKLARDNSQAISTRTLTFLSRWLIQHILGTDMRMANEIIALEKGLSPSEARARADSQVANSNEVLLGAMGELYESLAIRTQDFLRANHLLKSELAQLQRAETAGEQPQDLDHLNQATELLQNCLSTTEAYRAVSYMGAQLALGSGGALLVLGNDDDTLSTVATWGEHLSLPSSFASDCCWAMRRGQIHSVMDPTQSLLCEHFSTVQKAPYMCLPLLLRGKLLGMLHVAAPADIDPTAWLRLLRVATAMANAIKPVLGKLLALSSP